jgi:hypothetical protein
MATARIFANTARTYILWRTLPSWRIGSNVLIELNTILIEDNNVQSRFGAKYIRIVITLNIIVYIHF